MLALQCDRVPVSAKAACGRGVGAALGKVTQRPADSETQLQTTDTSPSHQQHSAFMPP